ncbi:intermembrane transport protein PqiB [Castellaniella sp.]|uniref:PqiB family protein n=1 Tax=Castellaniella sp. TaxID=1955812 RepID=UPI002AFF7510|nr:MlaD family protein [Castellaniella sp.]
MTDQQDTTTPNPPQTPVAPEVRPGRSLRWSWVWLVPLLALVVALSLLASVWVRNGPVITITFPEAAGIEAGQTKLRYRNVVVGVVKTVRVDRDREHVQVDVQLDREGSNYITQEEAKFWIVSPRVSMAGVSGLDTLLSGVYLSVDAPVTLPKGEVATHFIGLLNPPEVLSGQVGSRYHLVASSLGSLAVGSQVYYRRIEVGRVVNYEMAPDGRAVNLQIFIDAPYDRFVTADTRFWNDSGIDVSLSPSGVDIRTSGLSAILSGGITFAQADESSSFEGQVDVTPAAPGATYQLFDNRTLALAEPDGEPVPVEFRFVDSVRGLSVGAEIDYHGLSIGKVVDIDLELDQKQQQFYSRVRGQIFPHRFGQAYLDLVTVNNGATGNALLQPLIEHGLRAQLRSASLLTGQQYVALDVFAKEVGKNISIPGDPDNRDAYVIPTVPGDFAKLQNQISSIMTKLDALPIAEIGQDIQGSLNNLNKLMQGLDKQLVPQTGKVLDAARRSLDQVGAVFSPGAPVMGSLQDTLKAFESAARGLQILADSLQAQPNQLLRGPPPDRLH